MKFEYKENVEDRECVAYINHAGDLVLKLDDGDCIWLSSEGYVKAFVCAFNLHSAKQKIYRGDSVTITF